MELSLLSWNLAGHDLLRQVANEPADVALLQEVPSPTAELPVELHPDPSVGPWRTAGWKTRRWRTAIARISDRIELRPVQTGQLDDPDRSRLAVSRPGTLTAAELLLDGRALLTVVSWYATWEHPPGSDRLLGADGSAHRLLSDLAAPIDQQRAPRLLIAGDLNLLHGYGEHGSGYWANRYATVFDRVAAMGLHMVGPQHPHGRQADPWPSELPQGSRNVPTFHAPAGENCSWCAHLPLCPEPWSADTDWGDAHAAVLAIIRIRHGSGAAWIDAEVLAGTLEASTVSLRRVDLDDHPVVRDLDAGDRVAVVGLCRMDSAGTWQLRRTSRLVRFLPAVDG